MAKNVALILEASKIKTVSRKAPTPYKPFRYLDNRITPEARVVTKKLFETTQAALAHTIFDVNIYTYNLMTVVAPTIGGIEFDIDAGTKNMIKAVDDSGIRYGIEKFFNSVFK